MPAGQLDAASVTAQELKPLAGVTETVDVPIDPALAVAAVALRLKLGCTAAFTVSAMLVLADKTPLVPVTGSV